jgi:hypothetical protein
LQPEKAAKVRTQGAMRAPYIPAHYGNAPGRATFALHDRATPTEPEQCPNFFA